MAPKRKRGRPPQGEGVMDEIESLMKEYEVVSAAGVAAHSEIPRRRAWDALKRGEEAGRFEALEAAPGAYRLPKQ